MLVLSRKPGSSIVINSNIYITVLEVQGQRVRLGIDAPPDMSVHRHEIQGKPQTTGSIRFACQEIRRSL